LATAAAAGVLETRPSMGRGARAAAISMDASKVVAQCGQLGLAVAARYSRAGRSPPPPEGGSEEAEESFGGQEEIRVGGISEPGRVADSGQYTYVCPVEFVRVVVRATNVQPHTHISILNKPISNRSTTLRPCLLLMYLRKCERIIRFLKKSLIYCLLG
jgi:hypothetical protein